MENYTIQTQGLQRSFGSVCAVNGLDLNVPEGSIYGFLGPNGAGKTTTIRMVLGLIRPTAGQITLFGQQALDKRTLLSQIGALVETPSFYPHLTGRENLQLIAGLRGLKAVQVQQVLATVDLQGAASRLVRHYSLGMCQRLGLAIALLGSPRLLVLDEPTNGLDPAGIHEIRDLIRSFPKQLGITVFVSSHLLNEVEQIATHIGIIQEGRLIFEGTTPSLQARFARVVRITTDSIAAARSTLLRLGWQIEIDGQRGLKIQASGEADLAQIIQQLVQAGIPIYHASLDKPSLEEIFLNLTSKHAANQTAVTAPAEPQMIGA